MKETVALYYWDNGGLNVLVPKRRGEGFLRQPFGHHSIPALSDIEVSEKVDMCGLDGWLALEYGYVDLSQRTVIADRVLPQIAKYFGFKKWRQVRSSEFFGHLEKVQVWVVCLYSAYSTACFWG